MKLKDQETTSKNVDSSLKIFPFCATITPKKYFKIFSIFLLFYQGSCILTAIPFLIRYPSFPLVMILTLISCLFVWTMNVFISYKKSGRFDNDNTYKWSIVILTPQIVFCLFLCAYGIAVGILGIENIKLLNRFSKKVFFSILYVVLIPILAYITYLKIMYLRVIKKEFRDKQAYDLRIQELVSLSYKSRSKTTLNLNTLE